MTEPVRWGILSTARINRLVLPAMAASELVELVAVASRDSGRAVEYAREHGIPRAHGSYEELLADDDVEAVYVPLPNGLHVDWSVRALEAGKHVLCEKPLDWRPEQVERAFGVAEREGRILMEAFMYRHHPQTRRVAELVASGAIGELRAVRATFAFTLADATNVRLDRELGGGALLDVGCYCVSIARLVAGEPVRVSGTSVVGATGVDVRFVGTLLFPGQVLAHFDCGFDMPPQDRAEIVGSKATLVVPSPFMIDEARLLVVPERGAAEEIDVPDADRFRLELENMSRAIRGAEEPLLSHADAVGQARTLAALLRSAADGGAPVAV